MPMPLSGLAQTLSNSVARVQAEIVDTQNQLAAGLKTLNPGQQGVVTRLSAQATGYEQTLSNITTAQSVISVGQSALSSIATIMTQMQALANQASSAGLNSTDRDSLQATFSSLATQVKNLGSSASVNGNNLLNGSSLSVTTGIDGSDSAQTTVNGVDIAALSTSLDLLKINASVDAPSVDVTSDVHQVDTLTFTAAGSADAAGSTYTLAGLKFTTNSAFATRSAAQQATDLAAAFNSFINDGTYTGAKGSFSGSSWAAIHAIYTDSTNTSGVLTFTRAASGDQTANSLVVGGSGGATAAGTIESGDEAANQIDTISFNSGLTEGQSISVGGIIYTAQSTVAAEDIATDFYGFIHSNAAPSYGTFSGLSYTAAHAKYDTVTAPTGTTLELTWKTAGVHTATVTQDDGVSNAKAAIDTIKSQLTTVSTGQATLSAAATGLTSQSTANTALKTGLTNTVNSIQNIDATAMQAKLQQLNNQQSIDYYLVSQMNTEAAAILSIFR